MTNKNLQTLRLYLFSTDICRSVYGTFERHSSVLNIPTELFSIPPEVFLNATLNPDNIGFGTYDSGVLDASSCQEGAPIFISLPHFLYAADQYKDSVDGLTPDANLHRTLFEVEPHTGLVVDAQKRLQINVFVQPQQFIDDLKHVSEVILPAVWINESTTIDEKAKNDLNNQVLRYFTIVRWLSIILIPVGVVILAITTVVMKMCRFQNNLTSITDKISNDLVSS